jgi:hypothetical protein
MTCKCTQPIPLPCPTVRLDRKQIPLMRDDEIELAEVCMACGQPIVLPSLLSFDIPTVFEVRYLHPA